MKSRVSRTGQDVALPTSRIPRTTIQREGSDRAERIRRDLSEAVGSARQDSGISQRAMAKAAGISNATLHSIEHDTKEASVEVLARVAAVLGGRLVMYIHAGSGPLVRDHLQARMLQELVRRLGDRWTAALEVRVDEPISGVIDAVLSRDDGTQIACEAHSELRRIEQQVRWASAKAAALAQTSDDGEPVRDVSRLLLLRATTTSRKVVAEFSDLLATAYPGRHADAIAALAGDTPWPGPTLLWCRVDSSGATLLDAPPRGIRLGR